MPALADRVFTGRVNAILPEVNATTRTIRARIELANAHGALIPGMFATLRFVSQTATDAVLLVPSEAVIETGTRKVVMLMQGEGQFSPAEIETGRQAQGWTEVKKGLQAGQKVVLSGQFLIDSEASLKGSTTRMDGAGSVQGERK